MRGVREHALVQVIRCEENESKKKMKDKDRTKKKERIESEKGYSGGFQRGLSGEKINEVKRGGSR